MKVHITNIYGTKDTNISIHNRMARLGKSLGFYEMGIYRYPVATDSPEGLDKRLDGIIAAVEPDDIVIFQLPTGNGIEYEKKLYQKIRAYNNVRTALVFHNLADYEDLSFFNQSEIVVCYTELEKNEIKSKGINYSRFIRANLKNCSDDILENYLIEMTELPDIKKAETLPDGYENMIHVGMGLHDKTGRYSALVGGTMLSVLINTRQKVCFHIFHDETLSYINKVRLINTAMKNGGYVMLHEMNAKDFELDNEFLNMYTIGTLFRLVMPEKLDYLDKLIYLDADLLFTMDIDELWSIDISKYSLAAVRDIIFDHGISLPDIVKDGSVKKENYFNAGVLYLNLKKIREKGSLFSLAFDFFDAYKNTSLPDQDALNYLFSDDTLFISDKYNIDVLHYRKDHSELNEGMIYHYKGQNYINFFNPTEYDKYYYNIRQQTEWGYDIIEEDMFRGYGSLNDKINMLQKLLKKITENNIRKIYYGANTFAMNNIVNLIAPKDGDYCILTDSINADGKMYGLPVKDKKSIESEEEGTFVVLVLPEAEKGNGLRYLESIGLTNGGEYFVIPRLLTAEQGGYWV